jgi:acetolactate decarboxylase
MPTGIACGVMSLALLFLLTPAACTAGWSARDDSDTLTQVSTIDALLQGVYDGVMTFETLRTHGDFGIGTLAALDGEMLAFDGRFFQVSADGVARQVSDDAQTPFAAVTFFNRDLEYTLPEGLDLAGVESFLDSRLDTLNTFYGIRIDGAFASMVTRSVPAQKKPYPPLTEVTAKQNIFDFTDVSGTVVGFRCPAYVAGVNVPGYHLHFLTEDGRAGGHVLSLTISKADASVDVTRDFLMLLPDADSDFYDIDLTPDNEDALEQAEK